MSRYETATSDGLTVVVGWDAPLQTYFGQVLEPEPEGPCRDPNCDALGALGEHELADCQDSPPELWVGFGAAMNDEIDSVDDLVKRLDDHGAEYGAVARKYRRQLEADRKANPRSERSPAIQRLLDGLLGEGTQ